MREGQQPLVILDRDGVINADSDEFIKSPDEFIPLPGSIEAIAELCRAGFRVTVASNQSGVGRGLFSLDTLALIHAKLLAEVEAAGGAVAGNLLLPTRTRRSLQLPQAEAWAAATDLNGVRLRSARRAGHRRFGA